MSVVPGLGRPLPHRRKYGVPEAVALRRGLPVRHAEFPRLSGKLGGGIVEVSGPQFSPAPDCSEGIRPKFAVTNWTEAESASATSGLPEVAWGGRLVGA